MCDGVDQIEIIIPIIIIVGIGLTAGVRIWLALR
jgi:hypothetical protein